MRVFESFLAGFITLLSVGLVSAQPQQGPEQEIVVRVGDAHVITVAEVREYRSNPANLLRYPDPSVAFAEALEDVVTDQLKRIDFFASGLHNDAELLRRTQRAITEELVLEYFRTRYQEKYIHEEAIRDAHEQMSRGVVYRQLILPKSSGASPDETESLKAAVAEIRDAIAEGEDFAEVAGRVAEDLPAAHSGYGEPITWRGSLTTRWAHVIFDLEEGEVRALESQDSFAIVQVERVEEVPAAPLDEVREEIVTALRSRFMPTAVKEFEREKQEAVDTNSVRWNQEGLEQVVAWSNTPNFYEQDYRATLGRAIEEGKNPVIMTHSQGEVDVEGVLRLLDEVLILKRSGSHDAGVIKDFILEAVRTEAIAEKARALGLEGAVVAVDSPSTVLRNRIVRLYDRRMIEEQLPAASEGTLRAFHRAHRDSLFYQLATASLYAVIRSDREEAEALWSRIEQGVPFEKLTGRWSVKSFVRNREGEVEVYRSTEVPYLGEVAFELEEGEVRGPIVFDHPERGRQYAIVKRNAGREERPLEYEEVEDRVAEEFRAYHRARIKAAVEEALRAKYPVTIYHDVLEDYLAAE